MSKQTPSPIFQNFLENLRHCQFQVALANPEPPCENIDPDTVDYILENYRSMTPKQIAEHCGISREEAMRVGRYLVESGQLVL